MNTCLSLKAKRMLAGMFYLGHAASASAQDLVETFETGLPVYESTNHATGTALTLGSGSWFVINESTPIGTTGVSRGSADVEFAPAFEGTDFAMMDYKAALEDSGGNISLWLMSPTRTVRNGDVVSFVTRTYTPNDWADRVRLKLSTTGAATATSGFTQTLLSVDPNLFVGVYPEGWARYAVTISGLAAPVSGRLALHYDVPDNVEYSNGVAFDVFRHETGICRVAANGSDTASGASWTTPTTLTAALANVGCTQIWMKAGIYKPVDELPFFIARPVKIYSGFAGTESAIELRPKGTGSRTIISGDLQGDDVNTDGNFIAESTADIVGDAAALLIDTANCDGSINQNNTLLDGLVLTASAGGMNLRNCGIAMRNLMVSGNTYAGVFGSATSTIIGDQLEVRGNGVDFENDVGGIKAGVVSIERSLFIANIGSSALDSEQGQIRNTTFHGNTGLRAGGWATRGGTCNHCTFSSSGGLVAGAISASNFLAGPFLTIENSVFVDNVAASSLHASIRFENSAQPTILNSLAPANTCTNGSNVPCTASLGTGNPALAALADNGGLSQTRMPESSSAAIDAGSAGVCASIDQRGVRRNQGAGCDIGAVERRTGSHDLVVEVSEGGSVSATPAPESGAAITNCTSAAACTATYANETRLPEITLVATPAPGKVFASWAKGCSGLTATTRVTLDQAVTTCRAIFANSNELFANGFE